MSYTGTHPTGRRYYARSKSGRPLAFAVFVYDTYRTRWECVKLVEDRPYVDEMHRVNGSYVKYEGDMPPRVKAEQMADWYRGVINKPEEHVRIVELRPADGRVASP